MSISLHDLLVSEDYQLVEDAWQERGGRRTYLEPGGSEVSGHFLHWMRH
jgi:hypothetical protein